MQHSSGCSGGLPFAGCAVQLAALRRQHTSAFATRTGEAMPLGITHQVLRTILLRSESLCEVEEVQRGLVPRFRVQVRRYFLALSRVRHENWPDEKADRGA